MKPRSQSDNYWDSWSWVCHQRRLRIAGRGYKQDWGLDGIKMCLAKGEILKDIIPDELKIDK